MLLCLFATIYSFSFHLSQQQNSLITIDHLCGCFVITSNPQIIDLAKEHRCSDSKHTHLIRVSLCHTIGWGTSLAQLLLADGHKSPITSHTCLPPPPTSPKCKMTGPKIRNTFTVTKTCRVELAH